MVKNNFVMFENFSTALIQFVGFFGVFGFFVYQLLTDNREGKSSNSIVKPKEINPNKEVKGGFFGRRKKEVIEEPPKKNKKRWFN